MFTYPIRSLYYPYRHNHSTICIQPSVKTNKHESTWDRTHNKQQPSPSPLYQQTGDAIIDNILDIPPMLSSPTLPTSGHPQYQYAKERPQCPIRLSLTAIHHPLWKNTQTKSELRSTIIIISTRHPQEQFKHLNSTLIHSQYINLILTC